MRIATSLTDLPSSESSKLPVRGAPRFSSSRTEMIAGCHPRVPGGKDGAEVRAEPDAAVDGSRRFRLLQGDGADRVAAGVRSLTEKLRQVTMATQPKLNQPYRDEDERAADMSSLIQLDRRLYAWLDLALRSQDDWPSEVRDAIAQAPPAVEGDSPEAKLGRWASLFNEEIQICATSDTDSFTTCGSATANCAERSGSAPTCSRWLIRPSGRLTRDQLRARPAPADWLAAAASATVRYHSAKRCAPVLRTRKTPSESTQATTSTCSAAAVTCPSVGEHSGRAEHLVLEVEQGSLKLAGYVDEKLTAVQRQPHV